MIYNQKEHELAKSLEAMTDPDSEIYKKVWKVAVDQGFAKTVFLGYTIVDDWEGTPCVFMERAPDAAAVEANGRKR